MNLNCLMFLGDFVPELGEEFRLEVLLKDDFFQKFPKKAFLYSNDTGTFQVDFEGQTFKIYEELWTFFSKLLRGLIVISESIPYVFSLEINTYQTITLNSRFKNKEQFLQINLTQDVEDWDYQQGKAPQEPVQSIELPVKLFVIELAKLLNTFIKYQIRINHLINKSLSVAAIQKIEKQLENVLAIFEVTTTIKVFFSNERKKVRGRFYDFIKTLLVSTQELAKEIWEILLNTSIENMPSTIPTISEKLEVIKLELDNNKVIKFGNFINDLPQPNLFKRIA